MSQPVLLWEDGKHFDEGLVTSSLRDRGYELMGLIGQGSYAGLFLIRSSRYNTDFVAKISVHGEFECQEDNSEVSALKLAMHPNILAIYGTFSDSKFLYAILEYCQGGSLLTLVMDQGAMHGLRLYSTCHQMAQALQHLHRKNIAHQDIKPANVLLDSHMRPKLADFGLSREFADAQRSTRARVGSLAYMAPEVISGNAHDPFPSDVWSLGVTFFYIAAGYLPWSAECCAELENIIMSGVCPSLCDVAPAFRVLVLKMLMINVAKRATIDWVVDRLGALVADTTADEALSSGGVLPSQPLRRITSMRRTPSSSGSTVALPRFTKPMFTSRRKTQTFVEGD
jgi:serine/threonine protein kinase